MRRISLLRWPGSLARLALCSVAIRALAACGGGAEGGPTEPVNRSAPPAVKLAFVTPPTRSMAGVTIAPAVVVEIQDATGNRAASAATVSVELRDASSAIAIDNATVGAVEGRATFGRLATTRAGSGYVLVASSAGLSSATSAAFDVVPAAPSALVVTGGDKQSGEAGAALALPLSVRVQDAFANAVPGTLVLFAVQTGGGAAATTPVAADVNGVAAAQWTLGSAAGPQTLRASTGSGAAALSALFTSTASAAAASKLALVSEPPATALAGEAFSVRVRIEDRFGNPVGSPATGIPITARISSSSVVLQGTTTVPAQSGEATFASLAIQAVGTHAVGFSAPNLAPATARAIQVRPDRPAALAIVAGNAQAGGVSAPLSVAPSVRVVDAFGNPVPGVPVRFTVQTGGGSTVAVPVTSAADGLASAAWTLGGVAGAQTLRISIDDTAPPIQVVFTATAMAGTAARLTIVAGDAQVSAVATALAVAPSVRVVDAFGNPVSGTAVRFAVVTGGGTTTATPVLSGTDGVAAAPWTLGSAAGVQSLRASIDGSAAPIAVIFTATALAGSAGRLVIEAVPPTLAAGQRFLARLRVEDRYGNMVGAADPGLSVTARLVPPSGTLGGTTTVVTQNGIALFPDLEVRTAGSFAIEFTAPGVASVATNVIPVRAGTPARIVIAGGNEQVAEVGTLLTAAPAVRVLDAADNPVSGVIVWRGVVSAGTTPNISDTTDAAGLATFPWTLGTVAGPHRLQVLLGDSSVTFSATAVPGAPATMVKLAGDGQTSTVGTPVALAPTVVVRDAHANPVPRAVVRVATLSGGGTVPDSVIAGDDGRAAVASWTLGITAGANTMSMTAGATSATFTASALAGEAATVTLARTSVRLTKWADTVTVPLTARDRYGNVAATPSMVWSSSDPGVARVGDASPLVTSGHAGSATITGSYRSTSVILGVDVPFQDNPRCALPRAPSRGAVAGAPRFASVSGLTPADTLIQPGFFGIPLDMNIDGWDDLVVINHDYRNRTPHGGMRIYLNNRDGTFAIAPAATVLTGGAFLPDQPRDIEVADLNGDRRPDLVVVQHGYDAPPYPGAPSFLFFNNGAGGFANASANLNPRENDSFTHGVATGDVDCDGDVDIFQSNLGTAPAPTPHLQINLGGGLFRADDTRLPPELMTGDTHISAEFIDFDGDGDLDLLLGGWNRPDRVTHVDLLLNDGFGRLRRAPQSMLPAPFFGDNTDTPEVKALDFDLDGRMDLILSQSYAYQTPHLALWRNTGDGSFTDVTAAKLPQSLTHDWIGVMHVDDFNGDGWPDVLVAGQAGKRLFMNTGGIFTESNPFGPGLEVHYYLPIDYDRDGRKDIAVLCTCSPFNVGFWHNLGP
jgi:hypothetical protein